MVKKVHRQIRSFIVLYCTYTAHIWRSSCFRKHIPFTGTNWSMLYNIIKINHTGSYQFGNNIYICGVTIEDKGIREKTNNKTL